MSIVDRFTAYDENSNAYVVVQNEVPSSQYSGVVSVYDYSLFDTGEVLIRISDKPRVFLIQSKDIMIIDVKDIPQ